MQDDDPRRPTSPATLRESAPRGADWLAWSLQFLFGLLLGALVGHGAIARSTRAGGHGYWLAADQVFTFLCGAALLGAGLASFHGDRLWLSGLPRYFTSAGMKHNAASRRLSTLTGTTGGLLALHAMLRHFSVL